MIKKTASLSFLLFFTAACAPAPEKNVPMPSLPKLLEIENELEVGIDYVYKGGVCSVVEFEGPGLGNWTLIVVQDEGRKAMVSDIVKSLGRMEVQPVVMTEKEYGEGFAGYAPSSGGGEEYVTPERKKAELREKLKKHPAVIYRYLRKVPGKK